MNKLVIGGLETLLVFNLASGIAEAFIPKMKPERVLESIVEMDDAQRHNNRGAFLVKEGIYEEAIKQFKKAIEKKPDYAEAYNNLGVAYIGAEKFDDAVNALEKAIELSPRFTEAYFSLGRAYYLNKEYYKAIDAFTNLIGKNPDDNLLVNAYYHLSLIFMDKGQPKDSAEALTAAATIYEKHGDVEKAIEELETAVGIYPDSASAHYKLAAIYAKKGMGDEMAKELMELIRIDPDDSNAHLNLGIYYFNKGNDADAIDEFLHATKRGGYPRDAYLLMDISYYRIRANGTHLDKGLEDRVRSTLKDFWLGELERSNYDSRLLDKAAEYMEE